ncbi:unnamed protein product [Durusdinium trenchii]|uniref:Uncharacterized protein n=1 Tax=Durusdinium trenchii TaxID=1381693 RepID=A0ABP0JQV5_9DINO
MWQLYFLWTVEGSWCQALDNTCSGQRHNLVKQVPPTLNGKGKPARFLDWDGDGDTDALVKDGDGGIWLYERLANDTFDKQALVMFTPVEGQTQSGFEVVDWNSDGELDLLHCKVVENMVTVSFLRRSFFHGFPALNESNFETTVLLTNGSRCEMLAVDFDEDGDVDLILGETVRRWQWKYGRYFERVAAQLVERVGLENPLLRFGTVLAMADMDGDGRLEVLTEGWVSAGSHSRDVRFNYFRRAADGSFVEPADNPLADIKIGSPDRKSRGPLGTTTATTWPPPSLVGGNPRAKGIWLCELVTGRAVAGEFCIGKVKWVKPERATKAPVREEGKKRKKQQLEKLEFKQEEIQGDKISALVARWRFWELATYSGQSFAEQHGEGGAEWSARRFYPKLWKIEAMAEESLRLISTALERLAGIIERSDQSVECGSEEPEDEMFYDCLEPTVWALQGGPIVALDLQQVETEETAFYMIQMVSVPEMEEEKCQLFPTGIGVNTTGNFSFLGAAIGDEAYCNRHTFSTRVEPAKPCLQALADLPDAQTAMLLLRHCQSHVKLTHAMRVTPPHGHGPALRAFDEQVQACLEQIGGLPLTQNTWLQASLAIKAGGLGLRSTALHAPAAYIASITHLAASCTELDPTYRVVPPPVHQALTSYNQVVLPEDQIHSLAPSYQQRDLSATVDKAQQAHLIAATTGEAAKGHLQLVQQPGAGAWLTALPADNLGLHINTHLFRVLLRLRLRLPIAPSDGFCPLCDGVADSFGTTLEYAHLAAAGLSPELEKPGLLPARPEDSGLCEAGVSLNQASARRPADVWVPGWGLHGPAAFDFAVSSGLRSGVLPSTVGHGGHAALVYEERKRMHQRTEAQCRAQGLQFLPIVAEGCAGGWGPTAMAVFRQLGSFLAARTGDSTSKMTEQLMQGLSITLQRENARAVVRRLPDDSASFNALSEP